MITIKYFLNIVLPTLVFLPHKTRLCFFNRKVTNKKVITNVTEQSTDKLDIRFAKKQSYGDVDTNNITTQCFLCSKPTVFDEIQSKNITHLFEGDIASELDVLTYTASKPL